MWVLLRLRRRASDASDDERLFVVTSIMAGHGDFATEGSTKRGRVRLFAEQNQREMRSFVLRKTHLRKRFHTIFKSNEALYTIRVAEYCISVGE